MKNDSHRSNSYRIPPIHVCHYFNSTFGCLEKVLGNSFIPFFVETFLKCENFIKIDSFRLSNVLWIILSLIYMFVCTLQSTHSTAQFRLSVENNKHNSMKSICCQYSIIFHCSSKANTFLCQTKFSESSIAYLFGYI